MNIATPRSNIHPLSKPRVSATLTTEIILQSLSDIKIKFQFHDRILSYNYFSKGYIISDAHLQQKKKNTLE